MGWAMSAEHGSDDEVSHDGPYFEVHRRPDPSQRIEVVDIDGTPVAIADVEGEIHAFDDECTHRTCPLSEGDLDGVLVTCPCHKSRFDIRTGAVLNGPATQPIRVRRVVREGDRILVER